MVKFYMDNGAVIEVDITAGIKSVMRNVDKAKAAGEMYFADGEHARAFIDPHSITAIKAVPDRFVE